MKELKFSNMYIEIAIEMLLKLKRPIENACIIAAWAPPLQDQNKLSQSQKRGGLKKLLKCVYIVNKAPN